MYGYNTGSWQNVTRNDKYNAKKEMKINTIKLENHEVTINITSQIILTVSATQYDWSQNGYHISKNWTLIKDKQ